MAELQTVGYTILEIMASSVNQSNNNILINNNIRQYYSEDLVFYIEHLIKKEDFNLYLDKLRQNK